MAYYLHLFVISIRDFVLKSLSEKNRIALSERHSPFFFSSFLYKFFFSLEQYSRTKENSKINLMPGEANLLFSEQTGILYYKNENLVGVTESNVCIIETFFVKVTKQHFFLSPHFLYC